MAWLASLPFQSLREVCARSLVVDLNDLGYALTRCLPLYLYAGNEGIPFPTNDTFCTQPAQQGVCRAYIPAFYFDAATNSCEPFVYGGCDGNMNNFETGELCKEAAEEFCTDEVVTISSGAIGLKATALLLGMVMATMAQLI